jgi:hypothetical protein
VAVQGYDVRPFVRHMEAEKLWEGPNSCDVFVTRI